MKLQRHVELENRGNASGGSDLTEHDLRLPKAEAKDKKKTSATATATAAA